MAMTSRGSDFNNGIGKVLAEKMRSSCVDCHYTWKYWVRLNPNDATKPQDAPRDNTFFGNAITKLLLLPIWLLYWFWTRQKESSEMTRFVIEGASGRLVDNELISQLVLEWGCLHPGDYLFGKYDPKVTKLKRTFEKILSENTSNTVGLSVCERAQSGHYPGVGRVVSSLVRQAGFTDVQPSASFDGRSHSTPEILSVFRDRAIEVCMCQLWGDQSLGHAGKSGFR